MQKHSFGKYFCAVYFFNFFGGGGGGGQITASFTCAVDRVGTTTKIFVPQYTMLFEGIPLVRVRASVE